MWRWIALFIAAACAVCALVFPASAKLIFTAVLSTLCLPGWLVVWFVWHHLLRQASDLPDPDTSPWLLVPTLVFIIGFSWVFWSVLISRSLKFVGLWNPFGSARAGRPIVLRALVFIGGWWEIVTRFGRQATGGWASLLEVLSCRFKDGDVFLGRPRFWIGGGMLRPIGLPTEKHMVTIAGTGPASQPAR